MPAIFLGLLLQQKGELQAAIECFEASRSSSEDLSDWLSAAVCRHNLGDVYLELGELDKAAVQLQEAQARFRELNSRSYLAAVLVTEARLKLYQGQLAAAQLVVDEAVALAEVVGAPEVLSQGQELQSQVIAALEGRTAT